MSTNDLLQKLRKLLAESADSTDKKQPWQELLRQETSVPSRSIRAAEAVRGFAGSWAASYTMFDGHIPHIADDVNPDQGFDYRLGKRGHAEINFVPYNWNTNRFGNKGPSLVGHPVSFEVVGSTQKAAQDWEFPVDLADNKITVPTATTTYLYGNIDNERPLWVLISEPGAGHSGVEYNGTTLPTCAHGLQETPKHEGTARYELFRVKQVTDSALILDGIKRLDEYFYGEVNSGDGTDPLAAKSITLLQPMVSRLAPVLDSDGKTFVFVPPERSAVGEYQLPHQEWILANGLDADYNVGNLTPIPKPLAIQGFDEEGYVTESQGGKFKGVCTDNGEVVPLGRFRIALDDDETHLIEIVKRHHLDGVGLLIHISEVYMNIGSNSKTFVDAGSRLTGYFEVVGKGQFADGTHYIECRAKETVNPSTGEVRYGPDNSVEKFVKCTFHLPVKALFEDDSVPYTNRRRSAYADDLDSARLTGLIDPKEVGRSLKVHGTNDVHPGGYSGRADRSIPNTRDGVDPGSLLDLGFRVVLFTSVQGKIDWDSPIASNEVVLDPNKSDEKQYVDIDYASGILKFSHKPVQGGDFEIDEKGRAVVYASFVPYSMEGGQRGSGVRITGGDLHSANLGYPHPLQSDVFSKDVHFKAISDGSISWGGDAIVSYEGDFKGVPKNGYLSIGAIPSVQSPYLDTHKGDSWAWTYESWTHDAANKTVHFFGLRGNNPTAPYTFNVSNGQGFILRTRADVKARYDRTYGSSARTDIVRFAYGDVTYNSDGSMTVMPTAVAGPAEELRAFFPLGDRPEGASEIARFHFEKDTQRWSTDDPPWYATGHAEPPKQLNEIGIEVSRGRLYTNWQFAPKTPVRVRHVMGLISDVIPNIRKHGPVPDSFIAIIPDNVAKSINVYDNLDEDASRLLSLRVEGGTLRSKSFGVIKDATMVDISASIPERFIFGVEQRLTATYTNNEVSMEACPVVKVFTTDPASAPTLQDLIDYYDGASLGRDGNGEGHFALSGRQVFAFPEKAYLASRGFTFPLEFNTELRAIVDLRQVVDEYGQGESGKFWTHFELVVEHPDPAFPVVLNDADEMALHFNQVGLYRAAIRQLLKNADFKERGGLNADLLSLGLQEHQLLFIGPNDPRFPHNDPNVSSNQICLIYTGFGQTGMMNTNLLGGILCELDSTNKDLKGQESLLSWLGGSFTPDSNASRPQARFGGYKIDTGVELYDSVNRASGNTVHLGFPERGTRPLGRFVGSFKIKKVSKKEDRTVLLEAYYPTGSSSDWHSDQTSSSIESGINGNNLSTWWAKTAASGWQGRLSWPLHRPYILPEDQMGSVAGLYDVYATFGVNEFNESFDAMNPILNPNISNPSFLFEVLVQNLDEWSPPSNVWSEMMFGDVVSFFGSDSVTFEGRMFTKSSNPEKFTVLGGTNYGAYSLTATGFDALYGAQWFSPNNRFLNPISVYGLGQGAETFVSISPSTISGVSGAVAHLVNGGRDRTDGETGGLGSEFLEGYSSAGTPSSVLIGSGRVSMLSTVGSEPTGFALHDLINPPHRGQVPTSINKSSVYIESGAFTTFRGTGLIDGGYYTALNTQRDTAMPQKDIQLGGVGGLRVSGDAHLWLDSIKRLKSSEKSAYVVAGNSPLSGLVDAPSGRLQDRMTTLVPGTGLVVQEATVQIGLTQSDLNALRGFLTIADSLFQSGDSIWMGESSALDLGAKLFQFGQMAIASHKPLFMPSLVGSYIALSSFDQTRAQIKLQSEGSNEGLWKIVGSPMVVADATAESIVNLSGVPHRKSTTDAGRQRESQVVAIMAIRVEGFRTLNDDEFETDSTTAYHWGVYRDSQARCPIYTGDVVDPGGSPTGAPASLRGLTIDPQLSAGKSYLTAELIPLEGMSRLGRADYDPEKFNRSGVELLGVHDQVGRFGKHFSRAFFAIKRDDNAIEEELAWGQHNTRARMVVLADEAGLVDGFPKYDFNGEINVDGPSGRVEYLGYPRRLGPGVIMDGGLGMVQANAFRARPRPTQVEHIGKLMVWGRGAYPLNNSLTTGNVGSEIPSVFNTSEFYGEVSISSPQGRIVFESPQAVEGLVSNMLSSEFMTHRHYGPSSFAHYVGNLDKSFNVINSVFNTTDTLHHVGSVVADTLFPRVTSGSVYRTPGTTVYERAYRSLDATGSNPQRKSKDGTHNRSGIAGMGVPVQGEVLLLPQGPVTQGSQYWDSSQGYYSEGKTPDSAPLYSFINGPAISQIVGQDEVPLTTFTVSPFGINLSDIAGNFSNLSYVDPFSGAGNHRGQMGTASQAYRHSNSREDSTYFAKNEARHQVRILDGMVIEDVTNGTFYTAGSVGRDVWLPQISAGLGIPGDGVRSPVNGSLTVSGYQELMDNSPSGTPYEKYTLPEVVYDLSQHCDTSANPLTDSMVGFGDRVDNGAVRRPLTGHKFRITPNVEFVPVLGSRGVSGGLIPSTLYRKDPITGGFRAYYYGDRGDGLFYDLGTVFKEDDIGKMLYICGTDEYAYTGWWVITDVFNPNDDGDTLYAHPELASKVPSLASVRKMNWDGRNFNKTTLPIPNFKDTFSICSTADKRTNTFDGRGHFAAAGASNVSMDDLYVIIHDKDGTPWVDVVASTDFTFETAGHAANFLNNNDIANGKQWEIDVKGAVPADANQFIFWTSRANALHAEMRPRLSNYASSFTGGLTTFQIYWRTRTDGTHAVFEGENLVGFGYCKGHNLGATRNVGDANNALPVAYQCPPIKFEGYRDNPARGLRWVFSHPLTEENAGSYVTLTKPPVYRFSTALPSQQSLTSSPFMYDAKWTSGSVKRGDVLKEMDLLTDIFRVNRCATTTRMILGGDCEVFHPEFNFQYFGNTNGNPLNLPVMYSPLSVHGNWQDTETGELPDTGALNFPMMYALQPIAREKIVTLSPSNAKSSVVFARGLSDAEGIPQGLQGVGPALATGPSLPSSPTSSFSMEPWQLVSRSDLSRTTMAQPTLWNYDGRVELNNANFNKIQVVVLRNEAIQDLAENNASQADHQQQLADSNTEIADITSQIVGLQSDLTTYAVDYVNQLNALAKVYSTPQGQIAADLELQYEKKKEDYDSLLTLVDRAEQEKLNLTSAINDTDASIASVTTEKAQAEANKVDILVAIAPLQDEQNTLQKEIADTEVNIADQEALIAQLTKEMFDWENTLKDYDANIDWEADYSGNDVIVSDLVTKIKQARNDRKVAQGEVYSLLQKRESYLKDLDAVTADLDQLAQELAALDLQIADLAQAITKMGVYRDQLLDELAGDYSQGLINKLKAVQWDTVIVESVDVWDAYSPTVRHEVYEYWLTTTAPIDIKTTAAALATAQSDAGADVVLAYIEKLLAAIQATAEVAADLAEEKQKLQNEQLFIIKEIQNLQASVSHLQAIIDYWQEVIDTSILGDKLEIASPSTYVWTPAGEWWQMYQPAWDQHGPDASATPPTLRVDLTESFTQAIGPGSGLNTPHVNRFPRGVRLNRIWVNFGVWGNGDRQETTRFAFDTPGFPRALETGAQTNNMVLDQMYTSFNLILEIPSQNSTVMMNGKRTYSGNEAFPMGGRMPTASTNHASNGSDDKVFPGGTIVVPLYVNREAGDVMPNVMERFVTVGPSPEQSAEVQRYRDWSGGDYEHGFGVSHPEADDKSIFGYDQPRVSWAGSTDNNISKGLYPNAFNPVLWGGMDYGKLGDTELDGVFADPRFARVQSSVFPRSSVVGGGLRSAFTSGLIPDGSLFSKTDPHSLSAATLTGVTVAHSGLMPSAPRVVDGSYTAYNTRGGQTCPHGFTIALTPIGDTHRPYVLGNGSRIGLDPHYEPPNMSDEMMTAHYGRTLENPFELIGNEPTKKPFKVGNWLENIVKKYGIYVPSGSMLPPGSRVYLEIAVGPGPAAKDQNPEGKIGAGSWVGNIKLSFDVETVDGTAWTQDVNILGDEEG